MGTRSKLANFIFALCFSQVLSAQVGWQIEQLSDMPEPISNNAVCEAWVNGVPNIYSFGGIKSGKSFTDISLDAFRYNVVSEQWQTIGPLPDTLGKIAAAASNVKNMIYIIGGYHVFANGTELSSFNVHRYNPETDSYLSDGSPLPVAIDDQVQAVWRDSLIYVISGWSDTRNVANVQIYNPATDSWTEGTPVPNNIQFTAFGASGAIIGDTIYYAGGARSGLNFPAADYLRKGVIDPLKPDSIVWTAIQDTFAKGYRMASTAFEGRPIWLGGSQVTYNYDGIAYNGSGGVEPKPYITTYDSDLGSFERSNLFPRQMDFRGLARIDEGDYIVAGGMSANQEVSANTFRLHYNYPVGIHSTDESTRIAELVNDQLRINEGVIGKIDMRIYDQSGKQVSNQALTRNETYYLSQLSIATGLYLIALRSGNNRESHKWIKK